MSLAPAPMLDAFITNVARGDSGIWRTNHQSEPVSYDAQGHDTCHAVEGGSFWFAHRNACIQAVIEHAPPEDSLPFLDVGGGNGHVAAMLQAHGHRVVLVEPGPSGAAHARQRGIDEVVMASLVDLDVRPSSIGAIGLFDVLEHIEDDAAALHAMHTMLADGGMLYATVPAHRWLWSSADVKAGHYRRYRTSQLRGLLQRCGYEMLACSYYFRPLPLPMLLLRTLPEALHLRKPQRDHSRIAAEHGAGSKLLGELLAGEPDVLRRGRRMLFGASCILAARKRQTTDGAR